MNNNYKELINIDTIQREGIVPYGYKTVSRYFQKRILHIRERRNNVERYTTRGSAIVRTKMLKKIKNSARTMSIDDIGRIFTKIAGEEDEFIISRLDSGLPITQIIAEFEEELKK